MNENTVPFTGRTLRGELALLVAVCINSLGVVLMLYSGAGISAISSVPFAFSEVFPKISLGTWTYLFQGLLVLSLMILRRKFVPTYLFSFVVGFVFGELLDLHELWLPILPTALPWRILYFVISYVLICIGIALSNRCGLPIIPTDLFPRELADITHIRYPRIKIGFDVTCLAVTACLTFFFLGHLEGLGIGTIVAAFTMGKGVGIIGDLLDKHVRFVSVLTKRKEQDTAHSLTLHVTYTAFPGKRNVFLQAVQEARIPEITRQEAGCLQYDYRVSEENPDQILLTEQWATEAQQQAHLKQPHMQRQQQIKQTCIAETTVEKC
ncbi:DUF6198 family protein [uncultured Ruminococcus sp.]|uniref:DUF6198 family protein n=1 Tax=uncultured Ruminococcus sp. TaxID=165186 RepID=UPI00345127D3